MDNQHAELIDPYMWSDMQGTLTGALHDAIDVCWNSISDLEERGGIILHKFDEEIQQDVYMFMPIHNINSGTGVAPFLFTGDGNQFAREVIPMFKLGWRQYASFHTHPQFGPGPSSIDMQELFPGFPRNYIYSCKYDQLFKYTWIDANHLDLGVEKEEIAL